MKEWENYGGKFMVKGKNSVLGRNLLGLFLFISSLIIIVLDIKNRCYFKIIIDTFIFIGTYIIFFKRKKLKELLKKYNILKYIIIIWGFLWLFEVSILIGKLCVSAYFFFV